MTEPKDVILGWAAPNIKDQFPQLSSMVAEEYQRDQNELLRLKMRGIIPPAEHKKAVERMVKRLLKHLQNLSHERGTK